MEATLFWIGCGLLVFSVVLRKCFSMTSFTRRRGLMGLIHIVFRAAGCALIGFVASASMDLHGPSPRWSAIGALIGALWAIIELAASSRKSGGASMLLTEDLELADTSFSAILLAAVIMYAVIQAFKIPSGSMEDTLLVGDHLFVSKFIYGVRVPFTDHRIFKVRDVRRGDVVVFQAPDSATTSPEDIEHNVHKDFIKRAIGLPGDEIQIRNKRVYVNGQALSEPYAVYKDALVYPARPLGISPQEYQEDWASGQFAQLRPDAIRDNFGKVRVPAGDYFVMGDNRDGSFDSRFWGPLPARLLKGKAWVVYWPLKRIKVIR